MPRYRVSTRFMAFFLLLSFLLLSVAVLPIFAGEKSTDTVGASQNEKAERSSSVSLFVCNYFDFIDSENFAYKIGLGQTFQSRRISAEKTGLLFSALSILYVFILLHTFSWGLIYAPSNSNKITEFLHAKDGMI